MMDVKQSFQKITDWAKKHPVLAGGIVLVVVLLAWWISRQSGGSSGSMAVSESEDALPDFSGLPLPSDDGGSAFDPITDNVGGITQPAPVYDAPVFESLPSIPEMQDAGFFDPGSVQETIAYTPYTSPITEAINSLGSASGKVGATVSVEAPKATASLGKASSIAGVKTPKPSTPQTPTQKLGKGRNFTGYINGVYYVLGYPAVSTATPATGITPSSKSILKPGGTGTTGSRTPKTAPKRSR